MGHSKGIHHKAIGQGCQGLGEMGVVAFFTRVETEVLQQDHLAWTHAGQRRLNILTDAFSQALDGLLQ